MRIPLYQYYVDTKAFNEFDDPRSLIARGAPDYDTIAHSRDPFNTYRTLKPKQVAKKKPRDRRQRQLTPFGSRTPEPAAAIAHDRGGLTDAEFKKMQSLGRTIESNKARNVKPAQAVQKEHDRLKALHHKHKFRFMARAGNVTPQYGAAPVPPPIPKPSRPKPSAAHAAGYGMVRIPPAKPLPTNVEEALAPLSPSVQAFIQANLPTITVAQLHPNQLAQLQHPSPSEYKSERRSRAI